MIGARTVLPLAEDDAIPGLVFVPDLISVAEERALITGIGGLDLPHFAFQRWTSRRRSRSFGYSYDFRESGFAASDPIPEFLLPLREQVAVFARVPPESLVQVSVIRYDPGAGIGWHKDRPELGTVIGVSLGDPATMRFRRRSGDVWRRAAKFLPPRSAYHLAGEVRYEWEHGIPAGPGLRWSVTFRGLSAIGAERLGTARP